MAELKYLKITGYSDEGFSSQVGTYQALINPDKYTQSFHVNYSDDQGLGTANATLKYTKSLPQEVSFELLLDGTGVLSSSRTDVGAELESLKNVVYTYNGQIHKPNYLVLNWGNLDFQCCLTSMSVNASLFKSDGSILRARVSLSFKNFQSPKEIAAKSNKRSPDMTHERIVVAGDTLPAMTQAIYGDSKYYLKVASYNGLYNFRSLVPGSKIFFPPLI